MDQLSVGDKIFYYQKKNGYLGYGVVQTEKIRATEFELPSGEMLIEVLPKPYLLEHAEDADTCAYVVGVDWKASVDVRNAKTFSGIFSNQNVVCKIRHQETVDYLVEQFVVDKSTK